MGNFGATNIFGSCLYCGRKLRRMRPIDGSPLGPYGDGSFCTLGCAASFGRAAARIGFRLKPLSAEQLEQQKADERKHRAKLRAAAAARDAKHCDACQHTGARAGCYCAAYGCGCASSRKKRSAA